MLKPRWLFGDEATSALDEASEQQLFALLRARLPDTGLVSIAHRPALARFHERIVRFVATGQSQGPAYRLEPALATETGSVA